MVAADNLIEFGKLCLKSPADAPWLLRNNWRMVYYLATSEDHTGAYSKYINWCSTHDPKGAVGGWNLGIGRLQFEFLKQQGLKPTDRLLDLGCGSLRGGRYYMDYLDSGKYTGMDIAQQAIDAGKEIVGSELLDQAKPRLLINNDLKFCEFEPEAFDYIIAQSVFTHLPTTEIEEAFEHVGRVLAPDGRFYATFFKPGEHVKQATEFIYEFEELAAFAKEHGLIATDLSQDYPHPRHQQMASFKVVE